MATTPKILLVEDEQHLAHGIRFNLEKEGLSVHHVETLEEAFSFLDRLRPEGIILDLMLPDGDGLEILKKIRSEHWPIPVLILSAKNTDRDRIHGLKLGVDDYLGKPFHLEELLLRVQKMLRLPDIFQINLNGWSVSLKDHKAQKGEQVLYLTEIETKLLRVFLERDGDILSREFLLKHVWGADSNQNTRTVDNFISRLRRYFDDPKTPRFFQSVRGAGYRFQSKKS